MPDRRLIRLIAVTLRFYVVAFIGTLQQRSPVLKMQLRSFNMLLLCDPLQICHRLFA